MTPAGAAASSSAPAPGPAARPVALPADTAAYRRALQEKRFAELAAAAYAVGEPIAAAEVDASGAAGADETEWFLYPPGRTRKPMLAGFGRMEGEGVGVLSFRGTETARNWLSDFHVSTTGTPPRHHGFENCWQRLRPQVEAWLERCRPELLHLVGHSLGGAMAQIAAFALAPRWRIGAVVGFGAPLVGRRAFATAYDAMPIHGRPGVTLAEVTTTFVFKTDLVRSLALPRLGFLPIGTQIVIDEHGRPSDDYLHWHEEAFDTAWNAVMGKPDPLAAFGTTALPRLAPPAAAGGSGRGSADAFGVRTGGAAPSPPWSWSGAVDKLRPIAEPVVRAFPQAQAALLAIGALIALGFAGVFLRRDASYHSVRKRYVGALAERVGRWVPIAYQERGRALLAAGRAEEALPFLTAALRSAEAEARTGGLGPERTLQWTAEWRLARADGLAALGRADEAIAELTPLIESDGDGRLAIATSAEGRVHAGPQVLALQRRASAFEHAGRLREAIADHRRLVEARPSSEMGVFLGLLEQARRNVGAAGTLHVVFQAKKAEVEAEQARLQALREAGFDRALAAARRWAHARIAACAYQLGEAETTVAEASLALALDAAYAHLGDDADGSTHHLRGAAHARLQQREAALADMTAAVERAPRVAAYRYARANVRLVVGARFVPAEPGSGMAAIDVQLRVGEKELIEADLREALALDPDHAMAKTLLEGLAEAQLTPAAPPPPSRPASSADEA